MLRFWSFCLSCSVILKWYMLALHDINLKFLHVLFVGEQTEEGSCGAVFCQPQECPLLRIVWGLWPLHQGLDWWTYCPGNQEVFQWTTTTAWNSGGACWQTCVHRKPNDQLIGGLSGTEKSFASEIFYCSMRQLFLLWKLLLCLKGDLTWIMRLDSLYKKIIRILMLFIFVLNGHL